MGCTNNLLWIPMGYLAIWLLAPALDFEVFAELNRGESAISPSPQTTVSWGKSRIKRWIFFSNISGQTQVFVWWVSLPEVLFPMSTTVMHVARQDARSGDVRLLGICWENVVANIVNVRPDVAYSNGHRWFRHSLMFMSVYNNDVHLLMWFWCKFLLLFYIIYCGYI